MYQITIYLAFVDYKSNSIEGYIAYVESSYPIRTFSLLKLKRKNINDLYFFFILNLKMS